MKFMDAIDKLKLSTEFIEWEQDNKGSYLCYGFVMKDQSAKQEWQIGYYNAKKNKVTSFVLSNNISINPESDVFADKKILELDTNSVNTTLEQALKKAKELQEKKYSVHKPQKTIVILQNLDIGQLWNITYVTDTFKTLNIKINAASCEIMKHGLIDIFKFT